MQLVQEQYELQAVSQELCEICCQRASQGPVRLLQPSVICYECWHLHIKAAIQRISYQSGSPIISPFEGQPPLDVAIALNSLNNEHSQPLQEWIFKKYTSFTPDIEKCPSETCDYVFTVEKCKWGNADQKCPKCDAVLLHSSPFDLKSLVGFIYFLFLTSKCPKCEIPIQKTSGCPHMTCPCGHQFCWYCLKDYYGMPNNIYSVHEPKQCAFIFLSKIIFMSICLGGIVLTFLGNQFFHTAVGYFFDLMKYVLLTILLDLILIGNVLLGNQIIQKVRHGPLYYDRHLSWKFMLVIMIIFDILLLTIFYFMEVYTILLWILIVEVVIALFGAMSVWLIVFSVETWFEFVC